MDSMSWSDDMRCLYCDGKLPLYRKITHGQFCSTSHRKAYWQEQERLAIERLHQTHTTIREFRSTVPPELILGPPRTEETPLRGFVPAPEIYAQPNGAPRMIFADPLAYEMERLPGKPVWVPVQRFLHSLPGPGIIRLRRLWFGQVWMGRIAALNRVPQRGLDLNLRFATPEPARPALNLIRALDLAAAGRVEIPVLGVAPIVTATPFNQVPPRMPRPTAAVRLAAHPVPAPEPIVEADADPVFGNLITLPLFAAHAIPANAVAADLEAVVPRIGVPAYPQRSYEKVATFSRLAEAVSAAKSIAAVPAPLRNRGTDDAHTHEAVAPRVWAPAYPEHSLEKVATLGRLAGAVSAAKSVAVGSTPLRQPSTDGVRALERTGGLSGPQLLSSQPVAAIPGQLGLAMAKGSRYPVKVHEGQASIQHTAPVDFPLLPGDVRLPAPPNAVPVVLIDKVVPGIRGLVPLKFRAGKPANTEIKPILADIATIPQPLRTETLLPKSKLRPLDSKPIADQFEPQPAGPESSSPAEGAAKLKGIVFANVANFWKLAPRDLKMLAFAIPALLALAFHRELPKVRITAPPSTWQVRKNLQNAMNTSLTSMRQAVMERAAVALDDDFRAGLDDWASRGDGVATWTFDATGFVRPGPLALYRPSMHLADYQAQFLGMIDQKALSWVVRASDFDNYYVVKLVVLKAGPRTTIGLTRYAVINGKAEKRVDTPVPIEAQPDTLYHVSMDVQGENFSLNIQGQMIDSWSEPRLTRGGIGFFTSRGEESRVRWIAVTHQYDMLGRLCAYLAPYETPTTNGSW